MPQTIKNNKKIITLVQNWASELNAGPVTIKKLKIIHYI